MVNFRDPITIARQYAITLNLWHTTYGVFIWEFITTLDYEWDVIRGHRPYKSTIWVYSITRISTILAIVLSLLGFNDDSKINCQAWVTLNVFFAYTAFGSASLLIVFRIIAIWNRDRIVILSAMGLWLANVAFLIYGTAVFRSVWSDESKYCVILFPPANRYSAMVSLVSDTSLLIITLAGLLRLRFHDSKFSFGRVLWNQSLVWLVLVTVAEVPPTVFMFLNLNVPMDMIFVVPNMVIMTIAATRMYRSLINLGTNEVSDGVLGAGTVSKIWFTPSRPVPPVQQLSVPVFSEIFSGQIPKSQLESGGTHKVSLDCGVDVEPESDSEKRREEMGHLDL